MMMKIYIVQNHQTFTFRHISVETVTVNVTALTVYTPEVSETERRLYYSRCENKAKINAKAYGGKIGG